MSTVLISCRIAFNWIKSCILIGLRSEVLSVELRVENKAKWCCFASTLQLSSNCNTTAKKVFLQCHFRCFQNHCHFSKSQKQTNAFFKVSRRFFLALSWTTSWLWNGFLDFLKVLSNNSSLSCWFGCWKGRPFANYVARARLRNFAARWRYQSKSRSTCSKSNGFLERALRIKPNNIIAVFFFLFLFNYAIQGKFIT